VLHELQVVDTPVDLHVVCTFNYRHFGFQCFQRSLSTTRCDKHEQIAPHAHTPAAANDHSHCHTPATNRNPFMDRNNLQLISWNVRCLNAAACCLAVHETITATPYQLLCLQETKLQMIDQSLAAFLGAYKLNRFAFKPVAGTKGGILLLWNDSEVELLNIREGCFSISAKVTLRSTLACFTITGVYGPSRRAEKIAFLNHLRNLTPENTEKWLVLGDFNAIYRARDKNNKNLNISLMQQFRCALEACGLEEIHLQNKKFTWSNKRCRTTLVQLDCFFCNQNRDITFENCNLHALSSSHSYHCPLLLTNQTGPRRTRPFKFENFLSRQPHFQETVAEAWNAPTTHTESFHRLGHKVHHTAKALKSWPRPSSPKTVRGYTWLKRSSSGWTRHKNSANSRMLSSL
jgi:exonuclease III